MISVLGVDYVVAHPDGTWWEVSSDDLLTIYDAEGNSLAEYTCWEGVALGETRMYASPTSGITMIHIDRESE